MKTLLLLVIIVIISSCVSFDSTKYPAVIVSSKLMDGTTNLYRYKVRTKDASFDKTFVSYNIYTIGDTIVTRKQNYTKW